MNAGQQLNPTRKKTKSIVSSLSSLIYAKSHLKLAQAYALTTSSSEIQVVLYHERFEEAGKRLRRSNNVPVTRRSNIIWLYDLKARKDG
ncbi:hypothetical protein ALC57_07421 [Trachymyrmex cornetzi]|uniref:Uncharacterized protein n=1 Tax=Trachymyrmex cornetzi TaxID=471704 RepID=A0A195E4X8_9HYME|nr:hypothetical protein ALC57_07421 [Trachymyrmex cornetzi]